MKKFYKKTAKPYGELDRILKKGGRNFVYTL